MTTPPPPQIFDQTTLLSLLTVLLFLLLAHQISRRALSPTTPTRLRILFIWHFFDFLIHLILEGSFLYNCFYASVPFSPAAHHPALISNFLSRPDRVYGAASGDNWASRLWMVYAKADKRWGGADLTVVSLELLTVGLGAPGAAWVCWLLYRGDWRAGFWMVVLATGELYGGFMTFCPEWLTGNQNLDGSNFMYLWVYLVFFNMLWVVLPIYALWVSYQDMCDAFELRKRVVAARAEKEKAK